MACRSERKGREEFLYLTVNASNPKAMPQPGDAGGGRQGDAQGRDCLDDPGTTAIDAYRPAPDGAPPRYNPTNVAIAPNGDLYVGDGYGSYFVNQYNSKAEYIRTFGGQRSGARPAGGAARHLGGYARRRADPRRRGPAEQPPAAIHPRRQAHRLHSRFPVALPLRRAERRRGRSRSSRARDADEQGQRNRRATWATRTRRTGTTRSAASRATSSFPGSSSVPHGACFDHAGNIFVVEWVEVGRVTKLRKVA